MVGTLHLRLLHDQLLEDLLAQYGVRWHLLPLAAQALLHFSQLVEDL